MIRLDNADFVTLENLRFLRGARGLVVDDNAGVTGLNVINTQFLDQAGVGIDLGIGTSDVLIQGSTISASTTATRVVLDRTGNVTLTGNTISLGISGNTGIDHSNGTGTLTVTGNTITGGYWGIYNYDGSNFVATGNTISNQYYYGIYSNANNATISGNTITETSGSAVGIYAYASTADRVDISNNTVRSSANAAIRADASSTAAGMSVHHNDVSRSTTGIFATDNVDVTDNRIHGNVRGIHSSSSAVLRNLVYGNDVGIYVSGSGRGLNVAGNIIYDNAVAGLQFADFGNTNRMLVANNLFYQVSADAIQATSSSQIVLRNNVFTQLGGRVFNIADNAQSGFSSDYNLFDLRSGATLGLWGSTAFTSLADWQVLLANEGNSFTGTIAYTDVDGADDLLGQTGATDNGLDDDFTILNPQILRDAGDPRTSYYREASGNDGARANIGLGGAAGGGVASPDRTVQILTPNGGNRLTAGDAVTVAFRSSGLTTNRPSLFVNAGGGQVAGPESWSTWLTDQRFRTVGNTATYNPAIDVSGLPGVPAELFQTYSYGSSTRGEALSYSLDVPDGTYQITLYFAEFYTYAQRPMDIRLQGATVQSNFDILAAAGGVANKAVARTFTVEAAGGRGILLDLVNRSTQGWQPILFGLGVSEVVPASGTWLASLEVSTDLGTNWTTVATTQTFDRFGHGVFTWTPTTATNSSTALMRVTATNGTDTLTDLSDRPFSIVGAGNVYYVDDASNDGDQYTPDAIGDNANDGRSALRPMASLAALLRLYDLKPGDIVYIDTGVYQVFQNIALTADDSGTAADAVTLQGPTNGNAAILDRSSSRSDAAVFDFAGADYLKLSNLTLRNVTTGIHYLNNGGSTNTTLQFLRMTGISNQGIWIEQGNPDIVITDSVFESFTANAQSGVRAENYSGALTIARNTFDIPNYALYLPGTYSASTLLIEENTIFSRATHVTSGATSIAISSYGAGASTIVRNNTLSAAGGRLAGAISMSNSSSVAVSLIEGNTISGYTNGSSGSGYGINASSGSELVIRNNLITGGNHGIQSNNGVVQNNRIQAMTVTGITARTAGTQVLGNTITGGPVGIRFESSGTGGLVANNLISATSEAAINITGTANTTLVLNNTLIIGAGAGVLLNGNASGVYVANNILQASGGAGIVLDRSATQSVGSARNRANFNLFDLSGAAAVGRIADTSFTSLDQWALATGLDEDSLAGTPGFVNAAANDFRLQSGSIAIDRGDPLSPYQREPGRNGARVNIGHLGNTALATEGQAESVQVLSPNGLEKFERDQAMQITWRTSGLAQEELVGLYATNFGRYSDPMTVIAGDQSWAAWKATGRPTLSDPTRRSPPRRQWTCRQRPAFRKPFSGPSPSQMAVSATGFPIRWTCPTAPTAYASISWSFMDMTTAASMS